MILAGGLGTRLASVVSDVPKPMAPVAGRPFLEYLVAQARHNGCTDVVLCVKHLAQTVEQHFGDGGRFGVAIEYSLETELAGTAGAIKLAERLVKSDPFIVMNGDSYCDASFQSLLAAHRESKSQASLVAVEVEDASRYGTLELKKNNEVAGFYEKTGNHVPGFINAGIYALRKSVLDSIPAGKACSIEREIFPKLVGRGLGALPHHGTFIDIGTPESLVLAQTVLKDQIH
jgi:NDP-sugar pyrophosphorylase family protein